jgi:hypothetical protein
MAAGQRLSRAYLELALERTQYSQGLAQAKGELIRFGAEAKRVTFRDMVQGMSAAGQQASASSKLIAGVGAAGRQAAVAQFEAARASQTWTQRLQAMGAQSAIATRAGSALTGVWKTFGATLAVGAVIGAARSIGEFSGRMIDLSQQTGIATSRLQALDALAAGVDLTVEDLATSVQQLQKRLAGGDDSAEAAVEDLGFAVGELLAMKPDEMFIAIGEAVAKIEDPAERTLKVFELMGRTGTQSLRLMTDQLGKLVDDAEKNGPIIRDEVLRAADAFDEFFERAERRANATVANIFGTLAAGVTGWRAVFDGALSRPALGPPFDPSKVKTGATGIVHGTGIPARDAAAEAAAAARRKERDRAEADYREHLNRIGEQEIQSIEDRQQAEEQAAARQRQFLNEIGEQEIRDHADSIQQKEALDAEYRQFRNEIEEQIITDHAASIAQQAQIDSQYRQFLNQVEEQRIERIADVQRQIVDRQQRFADDLTYSITNGLADMLVGLRSFRDGFVGIWQDIRRSVANVLSQMLADFIGGYLRRAVAAATGGALFGGVSASAGTAAGFVGGGPSIGGIGALLSNPLTWAVAGGIGLGIALKKGIFRGGEEGTSVNPRRDRFVGQFGPPGTGPGSGFANFNAALHSRQLSAAVFSADTVAEWEAAQAAAVERFRIMGRPVQSFAHGGYVPPGVVMPAILHGGRRGEVITPLDRTETAQPQRPIVINNHLHIAGVISPETIPEIHRKYIVPLNNDALTRNAGGSATEVRRVVRGRA